MVRAFYGSSPVGSYFTIMASRIEVGSFGMTSLALLPAADRLTRSAWHDLKATASLE